MMAQWGLCPIFVVPGFISVHVDRDIPLTLRAIYLDTTVFVAMRTPSQHASLIE